MSDNQVGRIRGLSSPAVPVSRGGSFSDNKGGTLSHSLAQITSFMSTSFPSRGKRDDKSPRSTDVATLKEEFERKIAAVVFCLEEKAEENIDLSYKIKALQESSKQKEAEKDRAIEDLQKSLKSKEEECLQLEKKANDEVLNELNRRIQTITHCLNDMAEENLKLRTQVNANANKANANGKQGEHRKTSSFPFSSGSPFSAPPASPSSFSENADVPSSASFLSSLAASSSILTSKSNPSIPSTAIPPTAAPISAIAKTAPVTTSVSTNTSPIPTPASPPTTHHPSLPTTPLNTASLINTPLPSTPLTTAVADMKSEIIADEFLKDPEWLKRFSETYLVPPPHVQTLNLLSDIIKQDKSRVETRVKLSLDDRIKDLETQLAEHETKVNELKSKLEKETDRTGSLSDSVSEYERKLKELDGRMWDNLNKEAQRRTEAESKAKRLKKKVDELQFLLDELKDDGSDEDEEEEQTPNNEEALADSSHAEAPADSSHTEDPK